MLATPEAGTREHMLLWLASQPPERRYQWADARVCACGSYAREAMGKSNAWWTAQATSLASPFSQLNHLAHNHLRGHTYGELYKRALKAWV